eukprot:scaffold122442_cov69-Phaeocystis_antarctica.AAC.3
MRASWLRPCGLRVRLRRRRPCRVGWRARRRVKNGQGFDHAMDHAHYTMPVPSSNARARDGWSIPQPREALVLALEQQAERLVQRPVSRLSHLERAQPGELCEPRVERVDEGNHAQPLAVSLVELCQREGVREDRIACAGGGSHQRLTPTRRARGAPPRCMRLHSTQDALPDYTHLLLDVRLRALSAPALRIDVAFDGRRRGDPHQLLDLRPRRVELLHRANAA